MLTAQPSTYLFFFKNANIALMAQPSTYDMFSLIELYGRKVQSATIY